MISVSPAGRLVVQRNKHFNVAIFLDTLGVISVRLCMMIPPIELCSVIPYSVTLNIFQGHSSVKQF